MPNESAKNEMQEDTLLLSALVDYALANGLVVRPSPDKVSTNPLDCITTHAPVTLYPSPIPRAVFQLANDIQKDCNILYAKIACDIPWLTPLIQKLPAIDTFTHQLLQLQEAFEKQGMVQDLSLGLFRSDYMVQATENKISARQVEFNTISCSNGALCAQTSGMHKYLSNYGFYDDLTADNVLDLPANPAIEKLAEGLAQAHASYGASRAPEANENAILFVVQPGERNAFDQRLLEYALLQIHGIKSYRSSLQSVANDTQILDFEKSLILTRKGKVSEISVIYYRAGYGPNDYPTEVEWDARFRLECSRAIKCPSLVSQLSGTKKVQQVLASHDMLERFVSADSSKVIRQTFAALYPLDESIEGLRGRELALKSSDKYVLKPQREGGGNNIYRSDIPRFLEKIPKEQWSAYILMELIESPNTKNSIIRHGDVLSGSVINELGIFGTILWNQKTGEILHNSNAGYLLRTKFQDSDEGGVAAGFGSISSCYLTD